MCGIAGIICLKQKQLALYNPLVSMANAMSHRGPDGQGVIVGKYDGESTSVVDASQFPYLKEAQGTLDVSSFSGQVDNFSFGFAHRRLSIVDLSEHGHQPMSDPTGRYWIVFNGEIYNYPELAQALQKEGVHVANPNSDTSVLLSAYTHWGDEVFSKANGMFAAVIYDARLSKFIFARDRIGIKPLYYYLKNEVLVFASEPETILSSGLCQFELDYEGLWMNYRYAYSMRPKTAYKGIRSVDAGSIMELDAKTGEVSDKMYWEIPTGAFNTYRNFDDALEELESILSSSTRLRLQADVEVGTFMSGGVDSTTVSAIANGHHPGIKAFTLGFNGHHEYDEIDLARATAKMHGMEHLVKFVEPNDVLKDIDEMVFCYSEPFYSFSPNYIISSFVQQNNIRVVLSGLGGDELFAGYRYYYWYKKAKSLNNLSALVKVIPGALRPGLKKLKGYLPLKSVATFYGQAYSLFGADQCKQLFGKSIYSNDDFFSSYYGVSSADFASPFQELAYYDIRHFIGNHHLNRMDRFTMHHSIEGRFPFLDHRLIEFAMRLPDEYKFNGGIQKYILKKLASKFISQDSITMSKKGFSLPVDSWVKNEISEWVSEGIKVLETQSIFKEIPKNLNTSQRVHLAMTGKWMEQFSNHA